MKIKQNHKFFYQVAMFALLSGTTLKVQAQRVYQPAQFFFNQYISNAAMAGHDSALTVMAGYTKQMDNIQGSPQYLNFTADYYAGKHVGLGINIATQKAGILNQTRAVISYAYQLPVGKDGQRLSFGISGGITSNRIDYNSVEGQHEDPTLLGYNSGTVKMDGDIGIAYTDNHLNIQAALPSLRDNIDKQTNSNVNRTALYGSVSYLFDLGTQITSITPKVAFTQIKGYKNILDAGAEVKFLEVANIQAIYHSTSNFTAGFGVQVLSGLGIQAFYTSQPKEITAYTNGMFSVNAKVALFDKRVH
ncbi:PorP/SprF family type IX secretion system membrane protein [Chitinophaga sp. Cy-1792]|uniref:PorP/SprF family type IX secretion system membrane protein n=1 Tax=Chitinophaga sp. Cy-1792 TaxID=2608339 RepID=UPI001422B462|nr:PorP/SprF family type IX secretion system membrane protein [Chitinophaga sp. Cy-1792]NIG54206.1 type IX secretion system membrane protein PorP/SprF [Chitinophaga sp. Cy-1792]